MKYNSIRKHLINKSGASLLIVLAVMLLLTTVGASVLIAVGAGIKAGADEKAADNLKLISNSIHKTFMYGMQHGDSDINKDILASGLNAPSTTGGQILREAYKKAAASSPAAPEPFEITMKPQIPEAMDLVSQSSITLNITPIVNITPSIPAQSAIYDEDGNTVSPAIPRKPATASISGEITVTVHVAYKDQSLITVATYNLSGAYLEDNGESAGGMLIKNPGQRRLISHEKIDK